jgi:hypothetical protein
MQRTSRSLRTPFPFSSRVQKDLNAYALSAAAAGVALLAATQPANAEVVFTPANHRIAKNQRLNLDLNHDGIVDFYLINERLVSVTDFGDELSVRPLGGSLTRNAVWASNRISYFAAALPVGVTVDSHAPFHSTQLVMAFASHDRTDGYLSGGAWKSARNSFLGLKFHINGEVHFGWARLTVTADAHKQEVTATLTGYAYETQADTPIVTGQTSGSAKAASPVNPASASEPVMLGMLAMGAPGLSAWRREESSDDNGQVSVR